MSNKESITKFIPYLAANSKYIKSYFNFYAQDTVTEESKEEELNQNKFILRLLIAIQNSHLGAAIPLKIADQRIVALEELVKLYTKKDLSNLTKRISSKSNNQISQLLQTASFLVLPKKLLGHLALPLAKAWGTNLQTFINKPKFEQTIQTVAQLIGQEAEVFPIIDISQITAKKEATLTGCGRLDRASTNFNHDGTLIVFSEGLRASQIWDVKTGQCIHTLEDHKSSVKSAAFSPDGKLIVTASDDGTAKIWDTATGELLHTLAGHTAWINSAAFSPDGKLIVTASDDGTAKTWEIFSQTRVTAAEYIIYQAFIKSGLQAVQLVEGSYGAQIINKLNSRFPEDQPLIPVQ